MVTSANPPASSGPTALALAGLCSWLAQALGGQQRVDVAIPDEVGQERLCVWPVTLLADQGTRGGSGRGPLRLRARYIVTADGPIDKAIGLLDRVLVAAATADRYQLVLEPVPTSLWGTEGLPRPSVLIDVSVQIAVPVPVVPRVSGELRLDGGAAIRAIIGRVLGPHNIPLSGMTVSVPATGSSVVTDTRGGFILPGQPAGRSIVLQLSGRGLHLQVEVAPETTDPVVIHCDIEEV